MNERPCVITKNMSLTELVRVAGYDDLNQFSIDAAILLKGVIENMNRGYVLMLHEPESGEQNLIYLKTLFEYRDRLVQNGILSPLPDALAIQVASIAASHKIN